MATHSSFLAWRIPWTEEPDGPNNPEGRKELDTEPLSIMSSSVPTPGSHRCGPRPDGAHFIPCWGNSSLYRRGCLPAPQMAHLATCLALAKGMWANKSELVLSKQGLACFCPRCLCFAIT